MDDILIGGVYRREAVSYALEVIEKVSEDIFMVRIHWDGGFDEVYPSQCVMRRAALNVYTLDKDVKREKEFAKDMEEILNDNSA